MFPPAVVSRLRCFMFWLRASCIKVPCCFFFFFSQVMLTKISGSNVATSEHIHPTPGMVGRISILGRPLSWVDHGGFWGRRCGVYAYSVESYCAILGTVVISNSSSCLYIEHEKTVRFHVIHSDLREIMGKVWWICSGSACWWLHLSTFPSTSWGGPTRTSLSLLRLGRPGIGRYNLRYNLMMMMDEGI